MLSDERLVGITHGLSGSFRGLFEAKEGAVMVVNLDLG